MGLIYIQDIYSSQDLLKLGSDALKCDFKINALTVKAFGKYSWVGLEKTLTKLIDFHSN